MDKDLVFIPIFLAKDNLTGLIILLIFVFGPLIKSIWESFTSSKQQTKRPTSREDVKQYLEKMRTTAQQQASSQKSKLMYQEKPVKPVVKPEKKKFEWEDTKFDRIEKTVQEDILSREDISSIEGRVQRDIEDHVKKHINLPKEETQAASTNTLSQFIFDNKQFSDYQKAIIITEVFSKPKGLQN